MKLFLRPISIGGMPAFRQASTAFLCAALCSAGGGCGLPRDVGAAERCAEFMRRAYPNAEIEITRTEASATSLTTILATANGSRTNLPPDTLLARDLAVECRFDENVLTEFRWTAGPMH